MPDDSRRERCSRLLEEWRRPRLTERALGDDEVHQLARALLEHCLREGCRAELLQASAAYRNMDDFVRELLKTHEAPAATIRLALPSDDAVVAKHYLELWRSYGTPEEHFATDARERTLKFLANSRDIFEGGCVLAESGDTVCGSVGYQVQVPQFPEVLQAQFRKMGYVWSVYVDPVYRGQHLATRMVERALGALRASGCTNAVLHASEAGAPVYAKLGFKPGPEMRLKF